MLGSERYSQHHSRPGSRDQGYIAGNSDDQSYEQHDGI